MAQVPVGGGKALVVVWVPTVGPEYDVSSVDDIAGVALVVFCVSIGAVDEVAWVLLGVPPPPVTCVKDVPEPPRLVVPVKVYAALKLPICRKYAGSSFASLAIFRRSCRLEIEAKSSVYSLLS
jgi:hypothetical protein